MTAGVDEDGRPETPAWISVCALKDLLQLSPLQVVAALHSPDHLPLHHFYIPVEGAIPTVQWEREEHNGGLDRRDGALRYASDPVLPCNGE